MRGTREITVINMATFAVYRGRCFFPPREEKTVAVTPSGYAEIKACQFLEVFNAGFRCDYPGCSFIAKNERSLRFHKKQAHSSKGKMKDEVNENV